MIAVLASFGSALVLEHAAGLHADIAVVAVVLAIMIGRTRARNGARNHLAGLLLVPLSAAVACVIGRLMLQHAFAGDVLFTVGLSATIWMRRFGPRPTRAGTLVTLPLLALLVTPVPPSSAPGHVGWTALIAVLAWAWVTVIRTVAVRTGFLPAGASHTAPLLPGTGTGAPAAAPQGLRPRASTRMAVQMAVAVGAAFLSGHLLFPAHVPWVVVTAFLVNSGNRGRGDVLHKGVLRLLGALAGTAVATATAGFATPGNPWCIVGVFVALTLATWLRGFGYGFWAAGVTAALALLYGYYGESGVSLLTQRLAGILLGAVLGVAAAWFVLPVRSGSVLRRRRADALAALTDVLVTVRRDPAAAGVSHARFVAASEALEQVRPVWRAHRAVSRIGKRTSVPADSLDAVLRCVPAATTLAAGAVAEPAVPAAASRAVGTVTVNLVSLRRAAAGRAAFEHRPMPRTPRPGRTAGDDITAHERYDTALRQLNAQILDLAVVLGVAGTAFAGPVPGHGSSDVLPPSHPEAS
jgi:hypothetical protein